MPVATGLLCSRLPCQCARRMAADQQLQQPAMISSGPLPNTPDASKHAWKSSRWKATVWVQEVLEAFVLGQGQEMTRLFKQAERMQLDRDDVAVTGVRVVLDAPEIWKALPEGLQKRRDELSASWRKLRNGDSRARHPLGGCRPSEFKDKVYDMARWLVQVDGTATLAVWHQRAAMQLVGRGFHHPSHLDGLSAATAMKFGQCEKGRTLLKQAVATATSQACRKRARLAQTWAIERKQLRSAEAMAEECILNSEQAAGYSIGSGNDQSGPRVAIARAANQPDALQSLQRRAEELKQSSRKDKKSLASGLRAWHAFAVSVLGYSAEESLPPASSQHVLMFLALFQNAGTAANYVGCIAWACKYWGLGLQWQDDEVKLAMQGLKKQQQQRTCGILSSPLLLDQTTVSRLVAFCTELEQFMEAADLFVLAWQFLLRVQSEGVPIEVGNEVELRCLPPERHSALVVDNDGNIHLRLRCRKNKPEGSLLMRPCSCDMPGGSIMCASHRLQRRMRDMEPGQRLFPQGASFYLKCLHRALGLIGVSCASGFGFKAFRAGRATQLAREGKPTHIIMQLGEWKSASILNYVSADALDASVFWREVHEESN